MYFSQKVLRPLFAGVEESQGNTVPPDRCDQRHRSSQSFRAENVFRDMMLNEFLSVSQKDFPEQLHRHDL
jgi:hypothetical protein